MDELESGLLDTLAARDRVPPRPVSDLRASDYVDNNDAGDKIVLSWSLSPDDGAGEGDVVEYVVQDNRVIIVDEFTGRLMTGRRWSDGLHQAVEAKEGVKIERETETYATITVQNYFRLYEKLAGMTGTAETEKTEFDKVYSMAVQRIPTNRRIARFDLPDRVFKTKKEKYDALIDEVEFIHGHGMPVLVGTVSVEVSETVARILKRRKIPCSVLNAKEHQREAEIVARAGLHAGLVV